MKKKEEKRNEGKKVPHFILFLAAEQRDVKVDLTYDGRDCQNQEKQMRH